MFPPPEDLIHAFLVSIGHKFSVEWKASLHAQEGITALSYPHDLVHPWPREFAYRIEFFTQRSDATSVVPTIKRVLGSEDREHVLTVLGHGKKVIEASYGACGYRLAWTNILLIKRLFPATPARPTAAKIRPVSTVQDVETINTHEPEHLSSADAINDPALYDVIAELDGTIAAKAQMVSKREPIAYVSDIYTWTRFRRMGLGSALLAHLETRAAELGKGWMILVPSLMTRQIGFYEKQNYREAVPMHVLIPEDERQAGETPPVQEHCR